MSFYDFTKMSDEEIYLEHYFLVEEAYRLGQEVADDVDMTNVVMFEEYV